MDGSKHPDESTYYRQPSLGLSSNQVRDTSTDLNLAAEHDWDLVEHQDFDHLSLCRPFVARSTPFKIEPSANDTQRVVDRSSDMSHVVKALNCITTRSHQTATCL